MPVMPCFKVSLNYKVRPLKRGGGLTKDREVMWNDS